MGKGRDSNPRREHPTRKEGKKKENIKKIDKKIDKKKDKREKEGITKRRRMVSIPETPSGRSVE